MKRKYRSMWRRVCDWASGPATRASLFHSIVEEPDESVLPELWDLLRHPVRSLRIERRASRTPTSLFHGTARSDAATPLDWKGLLKDLVTGYRFALFIPSLWSDHRDLAEQRAELRTRRMEAGAASFAIHGMMVGLAVFFALGRPLEPQASPNEAVVVIHPAMDQSWLGDGREGGGGGGGGKREKLPPSGGRLPESARIQLTPPDPGMPRPLEPSDLTSEARPSVQIPIDLPVDSSLPIGDITAPPGGPPSSGPGSGGGIGIGKGPGIGSGNGPGAGTGSDGGLGKGNDGGIGDWNGPYFGRGDLVLPEVTFKPTPFYTEEARKARKEGIVVLQAVIRADGTVGDIRVIQGLGYGLDESAIQTIAGKWKFKAARLHGAPIDFRAQIEVTFRLY
jgi:periplasmic protein TonB